MNVLLVSANTLTTPYPVYPLGLDHVAGALGSRHRVRIADMNLLKTAEALGEVIDDFNPGLVGISLRNIDNTDCIDPRGFMAEYRQLVEAIRERTPAPLVLGGAGFTIFPEAAMTALGADFGIIGEGERLAELIAALERGQTGAAVSGVITPGATAERPLPWFGPVLRTPSGTRPHIAYYLERGGMLNLQTTRGCPLGCVYCTYPRIEGRRLRPFAPEAVARTAVQLEAEGARYLFITDSVFNTDASHCLAVARAFRRAGLTIPWGAFFAPTRPTPDFFPTLADAGLQHVEFGTESLAEPVLTAYGKPFRAADVFPAHRAPVEAGLFVAHYFLLGGPGETRDTLAQTLAHIERLKRTVLFFFCGMRIYPHTALHARAIEEGQVSAGDPLVTPVFYQAPDLTAEEILEAVTAAARGRINWVIGAGGEQAGRVVSRLHARGHTGPLWEHLIR